ncbi:L,D-transpeptidase family protein [Bacillus sp. AK031]
MYKHTVKPGETLWSISEDYRVSFQNLVNVNSITNPNMIYVGQKLTIPGIPNPDNIPYTIQISTTQRKLTLTKDGSVVKTYPIAVGRMVSSTPTGQFVIINKAPNPGGPFGTMWMSLSKKHYGIHGTNNPSSIGKAVSKGCIRMYNKDVEELSRTIPVGTRVIIRQ